MVVQNSEEMEGVEAVGVGKEELARKLLDGSELGWIIQNYRADIPELLHAAAKQIKDPRNKIDFIILCGNLVRFSDHLVQHVEPLILNLEPPWDTPEPCSKRAREDEEREVQIFSALVWLLRKVARLNAAWDWSGVFSYLTNQNKDVSVICLEIVRCLLPISPQKQNKLRNQICPEKDWSRVLFKLYATDTLDIVKLASDTNLEHQSDYIEKESVVSLDHVSLPRVGSTSSFLIPVPSTKAALVSMGEAVSSGKPVLLRGDVGVGKTSLIRELGNLTGREEKELLTLQISDSTDARLLLGLYRCTDIPGKFVWEAGLLTRAVQLGHWLTIEDVDRAQQDVLALLASLVQTGKLTVPNLGGSLEPKTGFQLFLTERGGAMSSDISKIARIIPVPQLSKDELREVIVARFPSLQPIIEKIIRLYEIVGEDCTGLNLKHLRQISLRDVVRWCIRSSASINKGDEKGSSERLYLDAVDCFCKFIPEKKTRDLLSEELAYTLNITKDEAAYLANKYKPQVTLSANSLQVGRVSLSRKMENPAVPPIYSLTRHSAVLLESVGRAVEGGEPVLLVGETGVGKTAGVQFLADQTGRRLRVINMNQQSDSTDLLGGYKPVDISHTMHNILQMFNKVFGLTFISGDNSKFLSHLSTCYLGRRWSDAISLMSHSLQSAVIKLKGKPESKDQLELWGGVSKELKTVSEILKQSEKTTIFSFIEGLLTTAVREGYWILLDEVNMATPETLECLSSLLDQGGSVCLYEKGDYQSVPRHPEFRLFACMNPATDTGKHDLPPGLRNRFTELYVDEISDLSDINMLVTDYLQRLSLPAKQITSIVSFFQAAKAAARTKLTTGTGERPTFSLRTLCRALRVANRNPCGNVLRSLYEGFSLSFLTELDLSSHAILKDLLQKYVLGGKDAGKLLRQPIPEAQVAGSRLQVEGFWIGQGKGEPHKNERYIMTAQVSNNLRDLSRVISLCDHPVLIQGDTSVGKTSLISYLAELTGNKCVRVNNHEHTDIQEYVGSYTSDETGKLVFKLGVLAEAMIQGSWVILDELNLAPTDVLEALNRVLDDNRQLYIPETQQTITAAPGFRLFGTQNPPGLYGGRKVLSKAFKNRFVELHFNQLPYDELEIILKDRCGLPKTYAKKMIQVLGELQKHRRGSAAFAGKEGFITLRDLFRWAERYRLAGESNLNFYDWEQHIAEEGFLLLAARIRNSDESQVVIDILEKVFKRTVNPENLFSLHESTSTVTKPILEKLLSSNIPGLAWTFDMRRMSVLLAQAFRFEEPVLLVGETGCGKTTAVQVLAKINETGLSSLNCHRHTESSDFLGGLRPDRGTGETKSGLNFSWSDGPLVSAMRRGLIFLADEISLADDSVVERLNSVLEPERRVLLAEKIDSQDTEVVTAHKQFRFVGTMNPGGDYGKKELSPALKNRFTEIWCPSIESSDQILSIAEKNLRVEAQQEKVGEKIVKFVDWIRTNGALSIVVSIRDILAWINFINKVSSGYLGIPEAFMQGAHLVWLDGLQMDGVSNPAAIKRFQIMCSEKVKELSGCIMSDTIPSLKETSLDLSVAPFSIKKRGAEKPCSYIFSSQTTTLNLQKILRALQINKPILLEGSPGIGKTSLVEALAQKIGQPMVRINLSDQTDICDLFGSDLPVEGGAVGQFAWRNGPFLDALQTGDWILLDELNLASQSVLEGLNAVFDHRGEVYIPELDRTFPLNENTRIFGCQNPLSEGGDRKGLPKSFLNRFSKVYMTGLTSEDYRLICECLYPELGRELISLLVTFNEMLEDQVVKRKLWGQSGAPWEFNLRDLLRWCQAMIKDGSPNPGKYVRVLYSGRFRRNDDKDRVLEIYKQVFHPKYPLQLVSGVLQLDESWTHVGEFSLQRKQRTERESKDVFMLGYQRQLLESVAGCVQNNWPVILTGLSESGKSSLVNVLSSLCSRNLEIISLNSSSDTMDLLGGFEQADIGRSILELFSQIQTDIRDILDQVLENNLKVGLQLMEETVRFYGLFGAATQIKKRKRQLQILTEMIDMIKKFNIEIYSELEEKLSLLKSSSKHGTFEWIDSILCKALREGSWLLIDNVNLCSASVLDRLNALFEHGGKLTVSERGVLDGEIPEVKPHPDFRVFLLYDPSRGDISRAMRNRGVEIYVPSCQEVNISSIDRMGFVSANLSSAISSDSAVSQALVLSHSSGFKEYTDKISILGLQALSGCALEDSQNILVPLQHRLCWLLSSANLLSAYSELGRISYQLLPVLEVQDNPELARISFNYFMNFMSKADSNIRLLVISLIFQSPQLTDICRKFSENKLFQSLYEIEFTDERTVWESRMLPSGRSQQDDLPNRLSLILVTYSKFKELQDRVNLNPKCLLSKCGNSFSLSSKVLEQFPSMVMSLLQAIETELNKHEPMSNESWTEFDSFLFWLYELGDLGLQVPQRNQEEDLERLLYVYWFWMIKRLSPLIKSLNLSELKSVFIKFNKVIESLNYDSNSFSRFRAITELCPVPPQTLESLEILHNLSETEAFIENRDVKSRINFIAICLPKIEEVLVKYKNLEIEMNQVSADILEIVSSFSPSEFCSSARFYELQLAAVSSRLNQLRQVQDPNNVFLPINLRLLMVRGEEDMETRARTQLYYCNNTSRSILALEHNPVNHSLGIAEHPVNCFDASSLVNHLLVGSGTGVPLVTFQEKREQILNLIKVLKNFKSPDVLSKLREQFDTEMKIILNGLHKAYDCIDDNVCIDSVLGIGTMDVNVLRVLKALSIRSRSETIFSAQLDIVLLNLLKLHIFGSLGAIDPAEKQALKYKQTLKELESVRNQILVIDQFYDAVGTLHPHRSILKERESNLEVSSSSMICRTAERGTQSFSLISNTVKHYKDSIGSVSTLLKLVQDLENLHQDGTIGSILQETEVWMKSSVKFSSDLLEHSSFPDLVLPIIESVTTAVGAVDAAVEQIRQKTLRDKCSDLEKIVLLVSDPVISPGENLNSVFQFYLDPSVSGLLSNNQDLKILKSCLVFLKQSSTTTPNLKVSPEHLHELVSRILYSWRSEQELKKKKELEDEAVFKTRTVCSEEDEEKLAEDEFKKLFPSFKEVFADISNTDNLNEDIAENSVAEKPSFSPVRLEIIKDIASFILKFGTTDISSGLNEISRTEFRDRWRTINSLISVQPGVNSLPLETSLIPSLITLANSFISGVDKPKFYNFYTDPNEEETKLMKPLLLAMGSSVGNLLEEFPENPLLLQILVIRDRILTFPLESPLSKNLTGLELLLGSCQEWEKNAHRGVSIQNLMDSISVLILRWRKLELSNWKPILAQSLETLRNASSEFWLHVMGVVLEAKNKTETVRALIQFIEASSLADFKTRLEILQSAQKTMLQVGSNKKWLISALQNIQEYYARFQESIDSRLDALFKGSEKKVGEFVKMARWKDTNFWSVKNMVEKTRKVLHKALREYKKAVSEPCKNYFIDEGSETVVDGSSPVGLDQVLEISTLPSTPLVYQNIVNLKNIEIGSYEKLSKQAYNIQRKILHEIRNRNLVEPISELVPNIVTEMEKLQKLDVTRSKTKEEQKKQAGFIQQRKRRALNDLFKTLQGLGLSYRHGLMNCGDLNTNDELFVKLNYELQLWKDCEKYFFRCWARYRQLVPLLDKQLPEDVSPNVAERFQGFAQHSLHSLNTWRKTILRFSNLQETIQTFCLEVKEWSPDTSLYPAQDYVRSLQTSMLEMNSVVLVLENFTQDYPEIRESLILLSAAKYILRKLTEYSSSAPRYFASSQLFLNLSALKKDVSKLGEGINSCIALVSNHPVERRLRSLISKLEKVQDMFLLMKPCTSSSPVDLDFKSSMSKTVFKSLLGIQAMQTTMKSFKDEENWLNIMNCILDQVPKFKCVGLLRDIENSIKIFNLVPESRNNILHVLKDVVGMLEIYSCSLQSVLKSSMLVTREFSKLLSVLLKVFRHIAVEGFCPIKGLEDEDKESGETDFKSSEEETGLGAGEGSKDVSDQIDNEDMLDGAYDGTEKKEEEKDTAEEENGIEMSDNFESQLQDKEEQDAEEDENKDEEEKELDDEVGEVEGNEELDKEMWGEQEEEEDEENLGESKEQGNTEEQVDEELSSNDKQESKKEGEKRERKDEEQDEPEFDDNQVDELHGEDQKFPEPEPMDLPDEMSMEVDEQEDPFEDHDGADEPEALPDFEDKKDEEGQESEDNSDDEDGDNTQVEKFQEDDTPDEETLEKADDEQKVNIEEEESEKGPEETIANDENKAGKDSVKNETEFDQSNKEESAGLNENSEKTEDNKSFSVQTDKQSKEDSEEKSGKGTKSQEEKTLADNSMKGERLELMEGNMTGEEGQKNADTFQHVMDKREEDRAALDRAEEDVKDQVFMNDFEMETEEEKEDVPNLEERKTEKSSADKTENSSNDEKGDKEKAEDAGEKEFVETEIIPRGTDSIAVRQDMDVIPSGGSIRFDTDLSMQQISLNDSEENNAPVLTQLSHQLSEQLRLILNPTKASSLQGDFRTGKRLNMRKIIPFIASDFKKDKIWLRRTKPNKREFQILVALDDSASMSDNKSRQIALESLNTISSALALLEAGQLGVLRFGESAEVIHPLNLQWSQTAGHKIQNQFRFDQKSTSVISLLSLTSALFHKYRNSAGGGTALSQLLVIISDGRGIFHEGKEKVIQSVVNSRGAGFFCLYLIVENPDNTDSVLDIRAPVFGSKGELLGIQSYLDTFPFQHYIILRDVENLPATLSDALRQWFQLVCA